MGYTTLANIYDELMTDFDYDGYYRHVKPYIHGDVLELAIGSGEFTRRYISTASRVIGVDNSCNMLSKCATKLTKYRKKLTLINDDMLTFSPPKNVDSVICVCDGINYIQDVEALATRVWSYLNGGGHFVFDISSRYKLENVLGNNTYYYEYNDICYAWQNTLNTHSVDMDLTIFEKVGDLYQRSQESQTQFIHTHASLINIFERIGYRCLVVDGEKFCPVQDDSMRILFILSKA